MAEKKTKLAVVKTTQNEGSVEDFINSVDGEQKKNDSFRILEMMKKASGEEPKMWGPSLIGFGKQVVKSPSGRQVEWFRIGFSPRKTNFSLYMNQDVKRQAAALEKLGKHKTGLGCLYINKLADVDLKVLEEMITDAAGKEHFMM